MTCFALILSFVSGFLVTTYLIGVDLSRFQVTLLTSIFLSVMVLLTWSMSAYAYWGAFFSAHDVRDISFAGHFSAVYLGGCCGGDFELVRNRDVSAFHVERANVKM